MSITAVPQFHRLTQLTSWGPGRWRGPQPARQQQPNSPLSALLWRPPTSRHFGDGPPEFDMLKDIITASYGWIGPHRNVPSAGSIYGLTISLLPLKGGMPWTMRSDGSWKAVEGNPIAGSEVSSALFHQLSGSPVLAVLSADLKPYCSKYDARGYRYALIEVGMVAQEIGRSVTTRRLAHGTFGAFDDISLAAMLGFELIGLVPLLVVAIGSPEPLESSTSSEIHSRESDR